MNSYQAPRNSHLIDGIAQQLLESIQESEGASRKFDWQDLSRDALVLVIGVGLFWLLGRLCTRRLQRMEFDQWFTPPWKPWLNATIAESVLASLLIGRGILLTGIGGLVLLVLQWHELAPLTLSEYVRYAGQAWFLLALILLALALSRVVARAVISVFDNPTVRGQLELMFPHAAAMPETSHAAAGSREEAATSNDPDTATVTPSPSPTAWSPGSEAESDNDGVDPPQLAAMRRILEEEDDSPASSPAAGSAGERSTAAPGRGRFSPGNRPAAETESIADTLARLVGMLIYLMIFLPVFMLAAELWGWSAAGSSLGEFWRWLMPLVGLSAIVLIGWFVLTATAISFCPPRMRRGVMIATAVLALVLFTASYHMAFAIVFAVCLLATVWLGRNDLPDACAGLYLQTQRSITVKTVHGPGRDRERQLLTCEITTLNGTFRVRNRYVLRSYLDGQMIDESRLIPVEPTHTPTAESQHTPST